MDNKFNDDNEPKTLETKAMDAPSANDEPVALTAQMTEPQQMEQNTPVSDNTQMQDGLYQGVYNGLYQDMYSNNYPGDVASAKKQKVKKGLSKGAITGIICGGMALIALIVCGIIFIPKFLKSDKEVVLDAFDKTFGSKLEKHESYISELTGYEDIIDEYITSGGSCTANYDIASVDGKDMNYSFSIDAERDVEKKQQSLVIGMNYDGKEFESFDVISDDSAYYIKGGGFDDDVYLKVPYDGGLAEILNNVLIKAIFDDVNIDPFQVDNDDDQTIEVYEGYVNAIENIWDNAEFDKKGKAKVSVNGKKVKAKKYLVSLKEEDIEEALVDIMDGVSEQINQSEDYDDIMSNSVNFSAYINQIKSLIPSFIVGDLEIYVYVKDGEIVKITCKDETDIWGTPIEYDFSLDVEDGLYCGHSEVSSKGTGVGLDFTSTTTDEGDNTKTVTDVKFYMLDKPNNTISFASSYDFNKATNDYSYEFKTDDKNYIVARGKINPVVKGEALDISVDEIKLVENGNESFSGSAKFSINTAVKEPVAMDADCVVFDVTCDMEKYNDYFTEHSDEIYNWLMNLYENGGPLFSDYHYMEELDEPVTDSSKYYLLNGDACVEIKGTMNGFHIDFSNDAVVSCINDEGYDLEGGYEYILFGPESNITDIIKENIFNYDEPEEDAMIEQGTTTIEGTEITYYKKDIQYEDDICTQYCLVRPLENGYFLCVTGSVTGADTSVSRLTDAILSDYFEIGEASQIKTEESDESIEKY